MTDYDAPLGEVADDKIIESEDAAVDKARGLGDAIAQRANLSVKRQLVHATAFQMEGDDLVSQLKSKKDIFTVYEEQIGKNVAKHWRSREDGNLASCPLPDHPDKDPSASFTLRDGGLWTCHGCEIGGDTIDLYAIGQGFSIPSYRSDPEEFREVIENACIAEGIEITYWTEGGGEDDDFEVNVDLADPDEWRAAEEVVPQVIEKDVELKLNSPHGNIAPPNTFLGKWMDAHTVALERSPASYHYFCGLVALGMAVGRDIYLEDPQSPIYGNLGIILYGDSGARKSTAINNAEKVLEFAMPHDETDPADNGIRPIINPASGESLIDQMRRVNSSGDDDPDGDPVRAVLSLDELEGIMKLMNRQGNTLQDALMQFLDGKQKIAVNSRGGGTRRVQGGLLSFIFGTQPRAVAGFINQGSVSNGLLNRFVWVHGEPGERNVDATPIDITEAGRELKVPASWAEMSGPISMSRDIRIKLIEIAEQVIDPVLAGDGSHLLNRIELHHKRIAFLLAVNERSSEITPRHIDQATYILESFIIPTLEKASADIGRDIFADTMRAVMEHIHMQFDKGDHDGLTRARIRSDCWMARKNSMILDRIFTTLIQEQQVIELKASGRKKRLYPFDEGTKLSKEGDDE